MKAMRRPSESGNILFYILLAIVLIGLVAVALRGGNEGANIDKETLTIRASEVKQYASELERGVARPRPFREPESMWSCFPPRMSWAAR